MTRVNRGSLEVGLYRKSMRSMWLSVEALIFLISSRGSRVASDVSLCVLFITMKIKWL